ncbi:uncharacterized protein LOC131676223 [Topomyia yanbarensis]|uniref:uncharacterized protein LOC131676223 n=1 Tax=Topomyia yanbarensis TaxID=2498891 RepID=UPI00273AC3F0|nr:uncharacterized protein LOC131676223 [Topomyia yanbarensis]
MLGKQLNYIDVVYERKIEYPSVHVRGVLEEVYGAGLSREPHHQPELRQYTRAGNSFYGGGGGAKACDRMVVSDRMCRLRIKGRFFNISITNVHSPHLGSSDDDRDEFYAQLEGEYNRCPRHDVKIVIGDLNVQVGQEPADERERRHFWDILDVRTYQGANVDSDHYLMMLKLRPKLSVVNSLRYRRLPLYNLDRLRETNVATTYAQHLEAALPPEEELIDAPVEDCWTRIKAAISSTAESFLGYVQRSRRNDWFDDECQEILD